MTRLLPLLTPAQNAAITAQCITVRYPDDWTQRDAISSPPNGLQLYNTTTDKLQVRAAGAWVDLH